MHEPTASPTCARNMGQRARARSSHHGARTRFARKALEAAARYVHDKRRNTPERCFVRGLASGSRTGAPVRPRRGLRALTVFSERT